MPRRSPFFRASNLVPSLLALTLAVGWAWRETVHAREGKPVTRSQTVNVEDVAMSVYLDEGKPVGQVGLYLEGETQASAGLVTGRFVIDPGKSPHPPHVHPDEEILIVESGHGEIFCDGKTTKVGPGSVMFSAPDVPHNITNTGAEPLTFYFMKWLPKKAK
ncbi:cupin domain-containing protein [Planctomyces sp. SH-PL62]|uniref:cupin domain-containing protein n=1 Tax=Planctomyces sp. SH-PL62 TaxID=1636152 RepID=UPI00078D0DDA|nr:cupin domain-containing protein [Planctomyces sp. SH-PL62]AMV39821.1 Cupin domain protein [Planctomyces sp. SH-PL62]